MGGSTSSTVPTYTAPQLPASQTAFNSPQSQFPNAPSQINPNQPNINRGPSPMGNMSPGGGPFAALWQGAMLGSLLSQAMIPGMGGMGNGNMPGGGQMPSGAPNPGGPSGFSPGGGAPGGGAPGR